MLPSFYWTLLILILVYATLRGRGEHVVAAWGCFVATIATHLVHAPDNHHYNDIEFGVIVVDIALFVLFVGIALRSQRFWPLWIAGFHLVTVVAHLLRAMKVDLIPAAYALAVQFWSYPVLLCIGIAIWRSQRRVLAVENSESGPPAAAA